MEGETEFYNNLMRTTGLLVLDVDYCLLACYFIQRAKVN